MKRDETLLLLAIASGADQYVRDSVSRLKMNRYRANYILQKWTDKGWYDWGVSVDLGWLTDEGKRVAGEQAALLKQEFS